jgi:hypothetical protein
VRRATRAAADFSAELLTIRRSGGEGLKIGTLQFLVMPSNTKGTLFVGCGDASALDTMLSLFDATGLITLLHYGTASDVMENGANRRTNSVWQRVIGIAGLLSLAVNPAPVPYRGLGIALRFTSKSYRMQRVARPLANIALLLIHGPYAEARAYTNVVLTHDYQP